MKTKVLERARIRRAEICEERLPYLRVKETPLFVNLGSELKRRLYEGEDLIGKEIIVRVKRVLLDPDTEDERQYWTAEALGDVL